MLCPDIFTCADSPSLQFLAGTEAKSDSMNDTMKTDFRPVDPSIKENIDNGKMKTTPKVGKKSLKPADSLQLKSNELEEYATDDSDEDFDSKVSFSKIKLVKNAAIYAIKSFIYDLKNFAIFYPLIKASSFITFCAWVFPLFFLYKKTGIYIPGMYSNFAMKHENWDIFFRNLYNVIPMALASFMIKYGQEAYFKFKN